jgi:hypothetical protein
MTILSSEAIRSTRVRMSCCSHGRLVAIGPLTPTLLCMVPEGGVTKATIGRRRNGQPDDKTGFPDAIGNVVSRADVQRRYEGGARREHRSGLITGRRERVAPKRALGLQLIHDDEAGGRPLGPMATAMAPFEGRHRVRHQLAQARVTSCTRLTSVSQRRLGGGGAAGHSAACTSYGRHGPGSRYGPGSPRRRAALSNPAEHAGDRGLDRDRYCCQIGRTSTVPERAAGSFDATSMASTTSAHSITMYPPICSLVSAKRAVGHQHLPVADPHGGGVPCRPQLLTTQQHTAATHLLGEGHVLGHHCRALVQAQRAGRLLVSASHQQISHHASSVVTRRA